jgi:cytochrome c oxidase subunit I
MAAMGRPDNSVTDPVDAEPGVARATASARTPGAATARAARLDVALAFGRYTLALPRDARSRLALGWLMLGVAALAASGILAVLLVLSRTPRLAQLFPVSDFFHSALVAHVDLSVLVWFLAFAGALWSLNSTPRMLPLGWAALALAALGAATMAIAPFAGGIPIMANYVPVIEAPVFLAGLILFAGGNAILVGRGLFASPVVGMRLDGSGALRFGLNGAIVATAVALIAFVWSYAAVPSTLDGKGYYELLFWGGGHVLQFTWTLLLLVAWLLLADATGVRVPLSPRVAAFLFAIGLVSVFATPLIFLAYDVTSVEHHRLQTWLMRFGGGLAIAPVATAVIVGLVRWRRTHSALDARARPLRAALVASIVLFGVGGIIGFAIHGSNVTIPAHYHGCIVGVTLAMMGLAYWLLPRIGFAAPPARLATLQARLYGTGQLLHVVGLLWSGGYGVQRKVADGAVVERSLEQIASMGLMGLGGLIAIAGGMLFVAIVVIAVLRRPRCSAAVELA